MSLKVARLSKRYGDTWALRDVSFDVDDGEVFGIFGPSGSGKTALLDVLRGVAKANGGSIAVNGKELAASRSASGLFATTENGTVSLWDRIRNRFPARDSQHLERSINDALSGLAPVVLLDDSFCGLDAAQLADSISRLRNAAREKRLTIIFASSDFDHILAACDRAAAIVRGEVVQVGTPQELYEAPESRVVASIVGRNNLFAARRLTSSKADVPEFLTINGGHRLFARRIERGALGALNQNITLAIRPEHISISFGASFPADNLIRATVTGIKFRGPTTSVFLDADGLEIEALVLRLVGLSVGEECMVGLPPDRIQICKD
jgi:ABC-type Fe3+/spermidine/putrescine transport system ATPase subunit